MKGIAQENYAYAPDELPMGGTIPSERLPEGMEMPRLFQPLELTCGRKKMVLKNRVAAAPMCMYSSRDGFPTPFHVAHLGQMVLHGVGTVLVEATAVSADGRISPNDMGIYKEEHVPAHASLVASLKSMSGGVRVGIQLAHAGRKASTWPMVKTRASPSSPNVPVDQGGWEVVGPSPIPFGEKYLVPHELSYSQIRHLEDEFVRAADRAFRAGYDFVELHSAHGYLMSSFNSPMSNKRTDMYGGSFENRTRFLLNIVRRIRDQFPDKGLWIRLNGTDGMEDAEEESWTVESTVELAPLLEEAGVDLLDLSSGGIGKEPSFANKPGYQVPYSKAVKDLGLSRMHVSAVGALNFGTEEKPTMSGLFAEQMLQSNATDLVTIGRALLGDPCWVEKAAENLTGVPCVHALQYIYGVGSLKKFTPGQPK
ncbi:NADPH dehydrogenase [Malassezia pachydermatis]|uniref:NADH:flavin oxidoreductase/NADH oxidase N-terminal domain-containing protein n=1 Tax=Malassezia pachydermatis TaxID=77020 RepID=A0A0M8MS04_9BASI|nr:hypothetical protein Malapachy_1565 [Malassezia pachydermatis]KOS13154.1 hypothetical protein Malapachy_1565 [Malassezia pachydermatis]